MRINRGDVIAGVDALELRAYFRKCGDRRLNCVTAMETFSISKRKAEQFIAALLKLELIREYEVPSEKGITYYETTIAGNAFVMAKAGKPVPRASAERILREFLDRVRSVNERSDLAHSVETVVVFGSYLSDRHHLNDLDIAVELKRRGADDAAHEKLRKASLDTAFATGRRFGNIVEELFWPQNELLLILKNRARTISLCEWESLFEMDGLQYCVLVGDSARLAGLIKRGKQVEPIGILGKGEETV